MSNSVLLTITYSEEDKSEYDDFILSLEFEGWVIVSNSHYNISRNHQVVLKRGVLPLSTTSLKQRYVTQSIKKRNEAEKLVDAYIEEHEVPPSYKWVADALGLASTNSSYNRLKNYRHI